jgi:hypothetical protein
MSSQPPSPSAKPIPANHSPRCSGTWLRALSAHLLLWVGWVYLHPPAHCAPAPDPKFQNEILPVLREFCFDCHGDGSEKGGVSLDAPESALPLAGDPQKWLGVWRNLDSQLMPPPEKPQPSPQQKALLQRWIESAVFRIDPAHPDPGPPLLRRLNREEYRDTIRDLLGVDFPVEMRFPPDDSGHGFDNNAQVLSLSPVLVEKYLDAAKRIVLQWATETSPSRVNLLHGGPPPEEPAQRRAYLRETLQRFAFRAFRRPVEEAFLSKLLDLCSVEPDFENALRGGMVLILSSPRFLFRLETPPPADSQAKTFPVDEFSLASRLSYFLWNSCPDPKLLELASQNKLRANLDAEIARLLKDLRSKRFTRNFGGQWLQIRDTVSAPVSVRSVLGKKAHPDSEKHFNSRIRGFFRQETEMFLHHLLTENRPAEELLAANYTFLNKSLAEFYGIPGVSQSEFTRVTLPPESHRVGLLTQGSFLFITSNPTRTSPVKRGLFVLDNLLGTPTPPPPPNIPPLDEKKTAAKGLSMRRLMEAHREDALCSSCHARFDPIGLALENFNALGMYRDSVDESPIDTAGKLATGETFSNVPELAHILSTSRKGDFYRRLSEKMLSFAIGRGLEYYDTPTVNRLVETLHQENGGMQSLVRAIVRSVPFQEQRVSGSKVVMDATPR